MKSCDTKRQVTTPKKKMIKRKLNQLPNIHILRRNPTNRWVDFKTTHQLDGFTQKSTHEHPLAWGNKKFRELHLELHT
jgi:hypothetical protein